MEKKKGKKRRGKSENIQNELEKMKGKSKAKRRKEYGKLKATKIH